MKVIEEYDIPIHGLSEGIHNFKFEVGNSFFAYFDNSELPGGDLIVEVVLNKRPQFLEFDLIFKGSLSLVCDRCLEEFQFEIELEEKLFVRFGEAFEELDDNIIVIPREESRFNIAQFIYEFAVLSIPYKKIHPETKAGKTLCNPEMIKRLNELKVEGNSDITDPRWDILKNLN